MASYSRDYDEALNKMSGEFFEKHVKDCSAGELRALFEIREARRRLGKLDEFIRGLR